MTGIKPATPDLKSFMEKRLLLQLNGQRQVQGILRGFDPFLNLVMDESVEVRGDQILPLGMVVIRGNTVQTMEALERIY